MTDQTRLFIDPPMKPWQGGGTYTATTGTGQMLVYRSNEYHLEESFKRFHAENPRVYETLVRLARQWLASHPSRRTSIKMLFEVARWEIALATQGEPLKLNNNYHAFYSRLMMAQEPDLAEAFETRTQQRSYDP